MLIFVLQHIKNKLVERAKVGHESLWVACVITWLVSLVIGRCIEKQIRCWKNCWYSWNIDKCNTILYLSSRNMIDKTMCEVLWRNISDLYVNIRVEVGKHPHVIFAMYFFFILNKNNERPDWMTDLNTLTSHGLAKLLKSIVYKYRILTSPAFQSCKYFCSTARKSILLSELNVKMLLFF